MHSVHDATVVAQDDRMRDVDFVDQPGVRNDLADRRDLAGLVARSYVA